MTVEKSATRVSLECPRVLVRDAHRDAAGGTQQRCPDVRTELVGMQDADAIAAQQVDERSPSPEICRASSSECDEADARVVQLLFCKSDVFVRPTPLPRSRRPSGANDRLEPRAVQVCRDRECDTLRSACDQIVDESDDLQGAARRAVGG